MCYWPTPTLHLNLALTGDGAFIFSLKKTHSVWFISVLNYGDTENVLINHLLLVIPMSYPCHYTNLCPHKPHKHAHTHTHTHTHTIGVRTLFRGIWDQSLDLLCFKECAVLCSVQCSARYNKILLFCKTWCIAFWSLQAFWFAWVCFLVFALQANSPEI